MVLDCGSAPIIAISSAKANTCFQDSGYLFYLLTVTPSAGQISRMCTSLACLSIYNSIYDAVPNECKIETKTGTLLLYEDFLNPIWDECKPAPTPTPTATPSPLPPATSTPTPIATTSAPNLQTSTPSTISKTDGSSSSKTTTVVTVIVCSALVIVAMIIGFVLLRKKCPNANASAYRRADDISSS